MYLSDPHAYSFMWLPGRLTGLPDLFYGACQEEAEPGVRVSTLKPKLVQQVFTATLVNAEAVHFFIESSAMNSQGPGREGSISASFPQR